MIRNLSQLIKSIYTRLFNWNKIIHFDKYGKNFFLGRRTQLHKCRDGKIEIGNNVRIGNDSRISLYKSDENKRPKIIIGDKCYICNHVTLMTADEIVLENDVLIASYVSIIVHNHGTNPECEEEYGKQPLVSKPIIIKSGAWIGERVVILPLCYCR